MRPHHLVHVVLLLTAAFLLAPLGATAGGTVTVPPLTLISRGATVSITVLGRIETQGTARVTFDYPSRLIRINGARGADGFGFTCPIVPIVSDVVKNSSTGSITFECQSGATISSDTLMILDITGVSESYPQTYGWLTPTTLDVNGVVLTDAALTGGLVQLQTQQSGTPLEGITGNYPNPFAFQTQVVYVMPEAGTVSFSVFSAQGRMVKEYVSVQSVVGENVLDIKFESNEIAQGVYVLRMTTDRGEFYYSFMVLN